MLLRTINSDLHCCVFKVYQTIHPKNKVLKAISTFDHGLVHLGI